MGVTVLPPAEPIAPERIEAVEKARQSWIGRLIDLSRRNNLLCFRKLKIGTLDVSDAAPEEMDRLLSGKKTHVVRLLPSDSEEDVLLALRQVKAIGRKALENLEEKGLETLYLALGFATWPAADGGKPYDAPVVMLPLAMEETEGDPRQSSLVLAGDPQLNPVLTHLLDSEYGCGIDADAILDEPEEEGQPFNPTPIFNRLSAEAAGIDGFSIEPSRAFIGNFSFQKMAMVRDLKTNWSALVANDLIAAIAGDRGAREAAVRERETVTPDIIDRRSPDEEFLVLDADSSQQLVVERVLAGQNGVVQGPPGTGKSQTIANLIACLAARGKRTLFVAEKRAALEAVMKRLVQTDLGHLTLDLHGADVSRRQVMERINEALQRVRRAPPVDADQMHRRLVERRACLNEYARDIHEKHRPSGLSVFEMRGLLLRLPGRASARIRWRREGLRAMSPDSIDRASDLLHDAAGHHELFLRTALSPWTAARLPDGRATQDAVDECRALSDQDWVSFWASFERICHECGHRMPSCWREAEGLLGVWRDTEAFLEDYDAALFSEDLSRLLGSLAAAGRGWLSSAWAFLSRGDYRAARRQMRSYSLHRPPSTPQLLKDARAAATLLKRWQGFSDMGTLPRAVDGLAELEERAAEICPLIEGLSERLTRCDLRCLPIEGLQRTIEELHREEQTAYRVMRLNEVEAELRRLGVGAIVDEIRKPALDPGLWEAARRSALSSPRTTTNCPGRQKSAACGQ